MSFVSNVLHQASALDDLSKQTHVNVEDLQVLAAAMSGFGVDADTLGKGLFTLSRKIAGGDESVATALHTMGMTFKDVEGLQGQELFLKMEHGLATLKGSLRDTAAADLFGGRLGAAMAGASENIDGAIETARRLNSVMSEESVAALDKYSEAIDRAKSNISAIAANMIGPVAEGFNVINDLAGRGVSKWDLFTAATKDFFDSWSMGRESGANITKLLDEVNKKTEAAAEVKRKASAASREHTADLTAEAQAEAFMSALQTDALKTLTSEQTKHLAMLDKIGALNARNAAGIGVTTDQYNKYVESLKATEAAEKKAADAAKDIGDAFIELRASGDGWRGTLAMIEPVLVTSIKQYLEAGVSQSALAKAYGLTATAVGSVAQALEHEHEVLERENKMRTDTAKLLVELDALKVQHGATALQAQLADIKAWAEAQALAARQAGVNDKSYYDALAALSKEKTASLMVDWDAVGANSKAVLQETADKAEATYQYMLSHADQFSISTIERFRQIATGAQTTADSLGLSFAGALDEVDKKVAASTLTWTQAMAAVAKGQGTMTGTVQAAQSDAQLTKTARDAGGSIAIDSYGNKYVHIPGVNAPGRAHGGSVTSGQPYTVGERGPETFVPASSGRIMPAGSSGSSVSITIAEGAVVINYPIMDDPRARTEIAAFVGDAIMQRLRGAGLRVPSGA